MRLFRPGFIAALLYPEALFRIKTEDYILYLTFDDGPDVNTTPLLLNILRENNIKACFFCSGIQAEKNSDLMYHIRSSGHLIGNHGYSHIDGWKTESDSYVKNVIRASSTTSDMIFRPPYGHIKIRQYNKLKRKFKIVFWDLLAYDFDRSFDSSECLNLLKRKIRPGSIIAMHDTKSSFANDIVDEFIKYSVDSGYKFEVLNIQS